jgi:hypothetical protein
VAEDAGQKLKKKHVSWLALTWHPSLPRLRFVWEEGAEFYDQVLRGIHLVGLFLGVPSALSVPPAVSVPAAASVLAIPVPAIAPLLAIAAASIVAPIVVPTPLWRGRTASLPSSLELLQQLLLLLLLLTIVKLFV